MKCLNCGHKLTSKEGNYCPECGSKIEKVPRKKKTKILMVTLPICLLLLATLIILYFVGKDKYDPLHKINELESALTSGDQDALIKRLVPYEDSFTMNEENASKIMELYQNNADTLRKLIDNLKAEVKDDNSISKNYATIVLEKNGKKWLLFDNYQFVVIPAFIEVSTTSPNVDIIIDGKKIDTTDDAEIRKEKYGPYVPGNYDVKVLFDNGYAATEEQQDVTLNNLESNTVNLEMNLNIGKFSILSTFEEDATLFVNDKETDIRINKGKQSIGPFPLDEGITLHLEKEMPWETVISQPVTIIPNEDQYNMKKVNTVSDKELEKILLIVNDVFTTYTEALNARDASLLKKNITDNMKKDLKDQIAYVEKNVPNYNGDLLKAQYRVAWYQDPVYNEEMNAYLFDIDVMFTYFEPNGNLGRLFDGDNPHEYKRGLNVVLLFDEEAKEWKVDSYTMEHFFAEDDDPRYEFE